MMTSKTNTTIKPILLCDNIASKWKCAVCHNIFQQPSACPLVCGAIFCRTCLQTAVGDNGAPCPACGQDFFKRDDIHDVPRYNKLLNDEINSFSAKCPVCEKEGTFNEITKHLEENCTCKNTCGTIIQHFQQPEHDKHCLNVTVLCKVCNSQMQRSHMPEHVKQCKQLFLTKKQELRYNLEVTETSIAQVEQQLATLQGQRQEQVQQFEQFQQKEELFQQMEQEFPSILQLPPQSLTLPNVRAPVQNAMLPMITQFPMTPQIVSLSKLVSLSSAQISPSAPTQTTNLKIAAKKQAKVKTSSKNEATKLTEYEQNIRQKYKCDYLKKHCADNIEKCAGAFTEEEEELFMKRLKEYPIDPQGKSQWGYFSIGLYRNGVGRTGLQCRDFYWKKLVPAGKIIGVTEDMRLKRRRKNTDSTENGSASDSDSTTGDDIAPTRKKKKIKDPNAPKAKANIFLLFRSERQKQLQNGHIPQGELSVLISEEWKKMTDEQKEPYRRIALADAERYEREMKEYNEKKKNKPET